MSRRIGNQTSVTNPVWWLSKVSGATPTMTHEVCPHEDGAADHVRLLLKSSRPELVADHGGALRVFGARRQLVIAVREKPPDRGRQPEHGEIVSRHQAGTDVHRCRVVVERQLEERRVVGGEDARQSGLSCAQLVVDRIEEDEAAVSTGRLNQDETTRIGHRQRAQHHRVEDGEGRSRRADAEPEREHGNGGESRLAREGPPDVSHVLRELVEQAHAALIPVRLLHLIDPAERAARGGARVLRRQAAMHVVKGQQLEVGPDVVVQIGVAAKAAEHSLDARDEPAEERDHLFSSSRLTRATVRAQLSASAASCFLPLGVIE